MSAPAVTDARPTAPAGAADAAWAAKLLFGATVFLSAFLLFQVQLIVSKYILPWFGGSAAVWITAMLVFQLLLLAGYLYSHVLTTRLSLARQVTVHLVLIGVALALVLLQSVFWPSGITPGPGWKPLNMDHPVASVASILVLAVGAPFFVLSTNAPLLQRWFARIHRGMTVYRLYSVSNLGSMLGLLSFPFLVEPTLRVTQQGRLWSFLFAAFAAGFGACAWHLRKCDAEPDADPAPAGAVREDAVGWTHYALWFALPACAATALLATTNILCQEVMVIPLLWVLPLALYLLSFIICFDNPRWYKRGVFHPLFGALLLLAVVSLLTKHVGFQLLVLPALLFLVCMVCHGEVARLKPEVQHLTAFYLMIAAGGAAGGIFVGIVAPRVFSYLYEFPLSLWASGLLLLLTLLYDRDSWLYDSTAWLPTSVVLGLVLFGLAAGRFAPPPVPDLLRTIRFLPIVCMGGFVVALGAYMFQDNAPPAERGFRFVQVPAVGLLLLAGLGLYQNVRPHPYLFVSVRNFFGAKRVYRDPQQTVLLHGRTMHGSQRKPPNDRVPTTYYSPESGVGILLQNYPRGAQQPLRMGVVGLGVGTLAAYGRPGDYIRYYEIDPDVLRLSEGPQPVFTFLRDSNAKVDVELGDARLLLETEAHGGELQNFDVLVLDAFSGDAVPVHLLTREAFKTYLAHLNRDGGVIAVHISSRYLNLCPVLQGIADEFRLSYLYIGPRPGTQAGRWILLSTRPELLDLAPLRAASTQPPAGTAPAVWTDDFSNLARFIQY